MVVSARRTIEIGRFSIFQHELSAMAPLRWRVIARDEEVLGHFDPDAEVKIPSRF
jgi:hypothetical protein